VCNKSFINGWMAMAAESIVGDDYARCECIGLGGGVRACVCVCVCVFNA
jgi:hypothetical protein